MGLFYVIFTFFITIGLGIPVAFSLGLTGLVSVFVLGNVSFIVAPRMMWVSISSFPLLAISLFIFAGELMNASGSIKKLLEFADALVGHIIGGLAHVNIVASMLFAGITGAAAADIAALGPLEITMMVEAGYDRDYSTAVTVSSALVGPIIPPSLIAILMGIVANISIGGLFVAGYLPGVIIGLGLMAVAYFQAKKRNYPHREKRTPIKGILKAAWDAIIPLMMPVIIMGGILGGVFTATEAAAVACVYALITGFFILKTLKFKQLPKLIFNAALMAAIVQIILAMSGIVGWTIAVFHLAEKITNFFLSITTVPIVILLLINVLLLIVGMLIEPGVSIIILAPILFPLAKTIGLHPLHFGMIMSVNLIIGLATPPVGGSLFIGSAVGKIPVEKLAIALLPYYMVLLIALLLITYIPAITMTLPKLFGFA
ncbi:MAG: TRAP transporter large permease [Candidatus Marinimicrobia bacterium]|nr:TRAP transporter large permease [Candidatus Neomarinimicrobiota bacterium]